MNIKSVTIFLLCLLASSGAVANTIRIALVAPLHGRYAAYGEALLAGAALAVEDLKASKLLRDQQFEIIPLDDGCDPDLALAQANRIIKEGNYTAVIGHACSAPSIATAKLYAAAKILLINPSASSDNLNQSLAPTMFRLFANNSYEAELCAEFITRNFANKRIAILHNQNLYSKELANLVSEQLAHRSQPAIMLREITSEAKKLKAMLKKIKKQRIDCLYFPGHYPEVLELADFLHAHKQAIPIISSDGLASAQIVNQQNARNSLNYIIFSFSADPRHILSTAKVREKLAARKHDSSGFALYAYAAVEVIAQAMAATNSSATTKLSHWLTHHSVDTVLGPMTWDSNGNISNHEFAIYRWQITKGQEPVMLSIN